MKRWSGVAAVVFLTSAMLLTAGPASAAGHHTWEVKPGVGTISAAVAAASPGDTLRLDEGTFFDSVFIGKPLTIRGEGDETVIKPPATFNAANPCNTAADPTTHPPTPEQVEGLCVAGQVDGQGNPVLSNPVHDVEIVDLRTTGFSDSGIIGFNTAGLVVHEVRSDHNHGYGIARFASTGSTFSYNWVSDNGEAGLYMGDSPHAASTVRGNLADHNGFGIFLRDSTEILATDNAVWGNCVGILALNSGHGATGASGAGSHVIRDNHASANDAACPAGDGPPTSGIGIALVGVQGTVVTDNEVRNNQASGPSLASGGIVIHSGPTAPPTSNVIRENRLRNNLPADIVWDNTGTGNVVNDNNCHSAIPNNLGWC